MLTKGLNTRERIIQKSAELFSVFGFRGCSLNDIMEATNLKKGGIYNHFRNKDEIALEAFDYAMKKVIRRFREKLDQDKTSTEKINSVISVFISFFDNPVVQGGCPAFNTALDAENVHPELLKKAREGLNTLKKYIEIKIEEGKITGEFKQSANADEISSLLIVTLEGAVAMSRVHDDDKYVKITSDFLQNYLENNLYN